MDSRWSPSGHVVHPGLVVFVVNLDHVRLLRHFLGDLLVIWVILESENNSEVSDWRIEGDDHLYLLPEDTLILSSEAVVTVVNPLQPVDNAVNVKGY